MATSMPHYPIGTPGAKWGDTEKAQWLQGQLIKRSYEEEVLARVEALRDRFDIEQYGALSCDNSRYPLLSVRSRDWQEGRRNVLVTGGVHGYETSGVQGAIRFLETRAELYAEHFNILVTPCISPWAYETINRWNRAAVDPNRSFHQNSPAEEAAALMRHIGEQNLDFTAHLDLHETTDTDNSEFRPALSARDGREPDQWTEIPDGFYLVGDSRNPQPDFQRAIIRAVEAVTHIAPPDTAGNIIGETEQQHGVINYPVKELSLCTGFTDATYNTTTEVYPDSPGVDDENCILAQVAAVSAGLDFLLAGDQG